LRMQGMASTSTSMGMLFIRGLCLKSHVPDFVVLHVWESFF